ncbi:MAG: hypothetical protein SV239_07985 [Thermodesulfobacteriota bacterium]|nr:hypothetical protein [Thermodesulfobacteriota bacterium]
MDNQEYDDQNLKQYSAGLQALRKRRLSLGVLILVYVPAIWLALKLGQSDRVAGVVFAIWILLVCVAVCYTAFARCPRCGNYFHMNGFIPLYLRRCLHCNLHVNADKQSRKG